MIVLEREGSSPWGTFGTLMLDDGWECKTVEPRWLGNAKGKSCIPPGTYKMTMRDSPVVTRTSNGRFSRGWEVTNVPGRTFIMLHPGNWDRNSDGCILVGREFAVITDGKRRGLQYPGVTHSQSVFAALMERLASSEAWDLHIIWASTEYP